MPNARESYTETAETQYAIHNESHAQDISYCVLNTYLSMNFNGEFHHVRSYIRQPESFFWSI
jgi:hypothetical protein